MGFELLIKSTIILGFLAGSQFDYHTLSYISISVPPLVIEISLFSSSKIPIKVNLIANMQMQEYSNIDLKLLEELVQSNPDDPSHHFNLVISFSTLHLFVNL